LENQLKRRGKFSIQCIQEYSLTQYGMLIKYKAIAM